jgi:hypothetical protein
MKAVCCTRCRLVVECSPGAVSLDTMGFGVSERDPNAKFAENTSKGPDIDAGCDFDVAAIFPAVTSEAFGRAFVMQMSVPSS